MRQKAVNDLGLTLQFILGESYLLFPSVARGRIVEYKRFECHAQPFNQLVIKGQTVFVAQQLSQHS